MGLAKIIMERVELKENSAERALFSLIIPSDLPQLEGHFPGRPITPSIVLIEISSLLVCEYFGETNRAYKSLSKSKVTRMIFPEIEHFIEIDKINENSFKATWKDGDGQLCAKFLINY